MARYNSERDESGRFDLTRDERDHQVNIRLTSDEMAEVRMQASAAGMTASEYIRDRVLGNPVVSKTDRAMLARLVQIGALQKHWFNSLMDQKTHHNPDLTRQNLRAVGDTIRAIHRRYDEG